jgi:hypothetical protein
MVKIQYRSDIKRANKLSDMVLTFRPHDGEEDYDVTETMDESPQKAWLQRHNLDQLRGGF